ncbi:hypothetical protein B0H19DRAFT_1313226 [Mycena capillaripes]|nr:hypothetical protein B0H19DRAFT_1313226 [Mycena capillaripes]
MVTAALRHPSIAAFVIFLVILIVGLQMLLVHSPYSAPSSGMHFDWTYLAVAIPMVVKWVWVAYDLQVKVLVPWAAMSRGFTPAHKGRLLDYVGANYFVNALGRRAVQAHRGAACDAGTVEHRRLQRRDHLLFQVQIPYPYSDQTPSRSRYLLSYLGRQTLGLARPRWITDEDIVMEAFEDTSSAAGPGETLFVPTLGSSADFDCTPMPVSYAGGVVIPSIDVSVPKLYQFAIDIAGT